MCLPAILAGGHAAHGRVEVRPPLLPEHHRQPPMTVADSAAIMDGNFYIFEGDTLFSAYIPVIELPHSGPLTDADFFEIADSLGVEAAAIKAVVEIETGATRAGFHTDGRPLVNFDLGLFRRAAARRGVNLASGRAEHPEVFQPLNIPRYGSHQGAHYVRLDGAMDIDSIAAIESTFWGMFQIGGFNWKLAGADSHHDFVDRISRSEYDQLVLFANFIRNTGLLKHLRAKNWSAFAKLYNGPGYAARGYHTRMAAAYRRYSREMTRP